MALTRTATATWIINRAALELGLPQVSDPYNTADTNYTQLKALINAAGEELATASDWEFLNKSHQITTSDTDSGDYPLPADFLYMLNQTGWERTNRVPLFGALTAQDWTYLEGRRLQSRTIYASFRLRDGLFSIYPQPPPNGLDINFEYQSKNWVTYNDGGTQRFRDEALTGSDVVMFDKVLMVRFLKVKFLEAKGFDSVKAQDAFDQMFSFITNFEKGAKIVNAGRYGRAFPYLDAQRNTPDTNFGT